MRYFLFILIVCSSLTGAWADDSTTSLLWPDRQVTASGGIYYYHVGGYPLSNMVDNSPRTAFVFNKRTDSGDAASHKHGVSEWVEIPGEQTIAVDGIGIINGYAKSSATYWRNNRIRRLKIFTEQALLGVFSLQESRKLQRLHFPVQTLHTLRIVIAAVDPGPDDDLCISSLVLLHHGRPIPWHLTRAVLYNVHNDGDCCCGGSGYYLRNLDSPKITTFKGRKIDYIYGVAFLPGTTRALINTEHDLYLYDFSKSTVCYHASFQKLIDGFGWVTLHTVYITTSDEEQWYRLAFGSHTRLHKLHTIPKNVHFISEGVPLYGEGAE